MRQRRWIIGLCAATVLTASAAQAATVTFTLDDGDRRAAARFAADGDTLNVRLSNTSPADTGVPSDLLTSVFFTSNTSLDLTPARAILADGSSVLFHQQPAGGDVGGEWAYRQNLSDAPGDSTHGIGSAGLNFFGPHDRFPGPNLDGPAAPGGMGYALTSAGDDPSTGNRPVTGMNPIVRNAVDFALTGLPDGFDPAQQITDATFIYGTSIGEVGPRTANITTIPAPSSGAMGLALLTALAFLRRRSAPA